MADRFPAQIEIGGKISPDCLQDLFALASDENCTFNFDESITPFETFVGHIRQHKTLTLTDDEACYGTIEEIEQFCRAHHLTFVRHSDGRYEWNAELVWWSPQTGEGSCPSDQNHRVLIAVVDVTQTLKRGTPARKIAQLTKLLAKSTPPTVPPLVVT
jgi:hypothetical protein